MDLRDQIIFDRVPLLAAPRFAPKHDIPLISGHHRYLCAEDGLWLEIHRPWLYMRYQVAVSEITLPYGPVTAHADYAFALEELHAAIRMFIADAREALPNEAAAWVIWNDAEQKLEYRLLTPDQASPGSITYRRPVLNDYESLAIDLHSHGDLPAGWSATDDADDAGETKIAAVVGEVNDTHPSVRVRLCLLGLFLDMESPL